MSHRSVIQTLDLHDDYNEYHTDACASQSCGWLSPRISFSTDFISGTADRISPEKQKNEGHTYSPEFEFSMTSLNSFDTVSEGYIVPADELFHQGKLLPGYIPPCPSSKDVLTVETALALPERPTGRPATIARHLSTDNVSASSPLGCVLGPSCVRASKGPKWRELFGALRRVKSDSGRQRIPDESILPPKALHGRKKFFRQFFSSGHGPQDTKFSTMVSRTSSSASSSAVSATQATNVPCESATADAAPRLSSGGSSLGVVDSKDKARVVNPPQPSSSEAGQRADFRPDLRGKSLDHNSDGFSFNLLPSRGLSRPITVIGRSSPARVAPRRMDRPLGPNLSRSGSGRVIVRSLDRGSGSGRNSTSFQEQARALRSREIRRSPDRSGYSASVRVTPVLNVPVCMGPVLRGASKAGKGRLSNFRSLLTFRSNKLPTSLSPPIATR